MHTSDMFLAPRVCFLAPIPALAEAADLLGRAADAFLAGTLGVAQDLLKQADMPEVRLFANSIMGKTRTDIHRYRNVAGVAEVVPRADRAKARRLSAREEIAVFDRDGFRCRYCGCRVVLAHARTIMRAAAPDALQWGNKDADKHAAFYALTAVADHFVPHARGGSSSEPDNLITACQPCNYGKNNWLIEQVGLMDPWTRAPVRDGWDGLRRMLSYKAPTAASGQSAPGRSERAGNDDANGTEKTPAETPSQSDWFAELDQSGDHSSSRLLEFLGGCRDLGVTWSLRDVFLIRMARGNAILNIMGVTRDGGIEVPWSIAQHKAAFRPFAYALERAIPGARAYETPKMWRVKKDGRNILLAELLADLPALRAALVDLHASLSAETN